MPEAISLLDLPHKILILSEAPSGETFLAATIRDFMRFVAARGNEAAAGLAASFADLGLNAIEKFEGRVVEQRPDEIVAVFGSAHNAARAAVELTGACRATGTPESSMLARVCVGLDTGPAIQTVEGYVGSAPRLAGSLSQMADLGTVLLTGETYHSAGRIEGNS